MLNKTFSDIKPVFVNGDQVGAFTVDVERFKNVMKACFQAIHFKDTGKRRDDWQIILPNLTFSSDEPKEAVDAWNLVRHSINQMTFDKRAVANPKVFAYAVADLGDGLVYGLRFYEAFSVFGATAM